MAGSLREIQAKIASTKKTSQITGAMQMVSASKLTRSEQAAKDFQIYASKIRHITTDLLHSELINGSSNPMLDARPVRKTGYIVITSDKGLVGGYNSTILKAVLDMIKRDHDSEDEYAIISIADPVSNLEIAQMRKGYELIYSQLATFLKNEVTINETNNYTLSETQTKSITDSITGSSRRAYILSNNSF